jgi:hypothetical protein
MKSRVSKRQVERQRWLEHVNAWQASDLTQKAFCQAHQLGYASFRRWRGIFKAEQTKVVESASEPVRFLPVNIKDPIASTLRIHLQDGLHIEVAPGFNPQLLKQVIQVLRSS